MPKKEPKQLEDLFEDALKDIYFAEKKILVALPKLAKAANSGDLKAAFEKHVTETEGQVERLERVFELIGNPAKGRPVPLFWASLRRARKYRRSSRTPRLWMPVSSPARKRSNTMRFRGTAPSSRGQTRWVSRKL